MKMRATGTFEVKLAVHPPVHPDTGVARRSIDKQFSGELEGTSQGEMLSAGDPAAGLAGYVAMERVTGKLAGRAGSFVLQHYGVMNRGEGPLTITVVPGTGTGELAGLSGELAIEIVDGEHHYRFDYALSISPGPHEA